MTHFKMANGRLGKNRKNKYKRLGNVIKQNSTFKGGGQPPALW